MACGTALVCEGAGEMTGADDARSARVEPPGRGRYICFKKIKALYDSRSKAAHGSGEADLMPYAETYAIARRVLLKMIEDRHVPDRKELEAGLFGDPVGLSPGPPLEQ